MTRWKIEYRESVDKKELLALDQTTRKRILKVINRKLTNHPQIYGKPSKHKLSGYWSLRIGDHRVIYMMNAEKRSITITHIGHRKAVYGEED